MFPPPPQVLVLVLALVAGSGCAHTMIIETEPTSALVAVNGEPKGESPAVTTQFTSTGGRLYVTATAEGYVPASAVVTQSEWFLWPAVLALTPALGIPFVLIPGLGLVFVVPAVIWAVVTSPTLLALVFMQKYPERVKLKMVPKPPRDPFTPSDTWSIPEDYDPNPPLLPDAPAEATPPLPQPLQPEGGNPIP